MGDLSEHFSRNEFACKDCGRVLVTDALVQALEDLRALAGLPVVIDDGYRCPEHNLEVGGVSSSQHCKGNAADLRIPPLGLQEMYELALQVEAFENGGIGVYDDGFIHVDVRDEQARWARVKNEYVGLDQLVTE